MLQRHSQMRDTQTACIVRTTRGEALKMFCSSLPPSASARSLNLA